MNIKFNVISGIFALILSSAAQAGLVVDSKLALVIDVSGSVDATDYTLQMDGYGAAFDNATVQANIESLTTGIAVEVFFFSNSAIAAGVETLLTSGADASAFATVLRNLTRPFNGGTNAAAGMGLANNWLTRTVEWESSNLIMDVSTDGTGAAQSDQAQRDAAASAGVVVNGIAIDDPGFFDNECAAGGYMANIITNSGQCFQAAGFPAFETAVLAKIQFETAPPVNQVPAPSGLALLGLGLLMLRRIKK